MYSTAARTLPLALEEMDRYIQGSQRLLPLGPARFEVVERHGAPGTAVDCEVVGDGVWLDVK